MSHGGDASNRPVDVLDWRPPSGPHRLPREVVSRNQRERLLRATALALAGHRYGGMTVEHILQKAEVSRATFYVHFDNKRDAVLAAHDEVFEGFAGRLTRACASQVEWPQKVRAAVVSVIAWAAEKPEEAQLLTFDALAAESLLVDRVSAVNDFLIGLLRNGREHSPRATVLPGLMERALIGAATSVVGTRLVYGQADQLLDLGPQLVQLLLMPYVGLEEAGEVAYGTTSKGAEAREP